MKTNSHPCSIKWSNLRYAEDITLKLHTAPDGNIWFAEGNCEPRSSNMTLSDITNHEMWQRSVVPVRVLGTRPNAGLLVRLYEMRQQLRIGRFEVAGPQVCETRRELSDPEITLYRMRQCLMPASLGGWHAFDEVDYTSYRLVDATHTSPTVTASAATVELLQSHPLWRSLSFIPTLNAGACSLLVASIVDPRWFIDSRKPNSVAKLRRFLGLYPGGMVAVTGNSVRRRIVPACWRNQQPSDVDTERPENFLWRVDREAGELRASQYFVFYLFHVWRNALASTRGGLLDMDSLFKTPSEVAAFRRHLANAV